jgi:hypothetical protein
MKAARVELHIDVYYRTWSQRHKAFFLSAIVKAVLAVLALAAMSVRK